MNFALVSFQLAPNSCIIWAEWRRDAHFARVPKSRLLEQCAKIFWWSVELPNRMPYFTGFMLIRMVTYDKNPRQILLVLCDHYIGINLPLNFYLVSNECLASSFFSANDNQIEVTRLHSGIQWLISFVDFLVYEKITFKRFDIIMTSTGKYLFSRQPCVHSHFHIVFLFLSFLYHWCDL